jgi:hypothetical protein
MASDFMTKTGGAANAGERSGAGISPVPTREIARHSKNKKGTAANRALLSVFRLIEFYAKLTAAPG